MDTFDEEGNLIDRLTLHRQTEEYKETVEEIRKLYPLRLSYFKRYWDKFKYNKARREHLVEIMDEADEQVAFYLQDDYKDWRDEIPGAREFLVDLARKKSENKVASTHLGDTIIRQYPGKTEIDTLHEVEYSPKTFNPFDQINIRHQEKNLRKVYIETANQDISSEEQGLTLGSSETEHTPSRQSSETEVQGQSSETEEEFHDSQSDEETVHSKQKPNK